MKVQCFDQDHPIRPRNVRAYQNQGDNQDEQRIGAAVILEIGLILEGGIEVRDEHAAVDCENKSDDAYQYAGKLFEVDFVSVDIKVEDEYEQGTTPADRVNNRKREIKLRKGHPPPE